MSSNENSAATDVAAQMATVGQRARQAAAVLATAEPAAKTLALNQAAAAVERSQNAILAANAEDVAAGERAGLSGALLDRLALDQARVQGIAESLRAVAALPDPVGVEMDRWTPPNGLNIRRVRTPFGVVGVIYESRPNVTADAGGLCVKSGNVAILRGGSESLRSSQAIHGCLVSGLQEAELPADSIQLVTTRDRAAVGAMLAGCDGAIDVIVPRGGRGLVERVQREARVPVFAHLEGICHVYVDAAADVDRARAIVLNSKMRRTAICGAAECLLVDQGCADSHLRPIVADLIDAGCEVRGDEATQAIDSRVVPATPNDWGKEYLDAIIAVRVVADVDEAIAHIRQYGSAHTDAIVTEDDQQAAHFFRHLDSAILMRNASTQFADGGEFGLGAEIGIATGKMHARGPVGVEQLTTFKYLVEGDGAVRP